MAKENDSGTTRGKLVTLPKGSFVFPMVNTPDNFKKQERYKIRISIPNADAQEFISQVNAFRAEAEKTLGCKCPKNPWKDDTYTEGNIVFSASCSEEYPPALYCPDGQTKWDREVPVKNKAIGRIRVWPIGYEGLGGGVSLRLASVQVCKNPEYDDGFDADEEYEGTPKSKAAEVDTGDDDDTSFVSEGNGDGPTF